MSFLQKDESFCGLCEHCDERITLSNSLLCTDCDCRWCKYCIDTNDDVEYDDDEFTCPYHLGQCQICFKTTSSFYLVECDNCGKHMCYECDEGNLSYLCPVCIGLSPFE
jgi:hypothetical protein